MNHVMNVYKRLPVHFERGEGVWLWDDEGKKYFDAVGGMAVNILGHSHPRVIQAIQEQATRMTWHFRRVRSSCDQLGRRRRADFPFPQKHFARLV